MLAGGETEDGHAVAAQPALSLRVHVGADERVFQRLSSTVADGRELPRADCFSVPGDTMVVYGWLNAAAWKHAHESLRFELVRTQAALVRAPEAGPSSPPTEVEELARFDEQTRWLYDRCADGWGAAIVRDEHFLNARFVDGPVRDYLRLGVRDDEGVLRGYAVVRFAPHRRVGTDFAAFGPGGRATRSPAVPAAFLVDWLVPHDEPEVADLMHDAVLAHARARRAEAVVVVVPEWSRWFQRFQDWRWIVEPGERLVAVRSTIPKFDMHWLRDHWWYQLAESHLV